MSSAAHVETTFRENAEFLEKNTEYELGTHVLTTFSENVECLQNLRNMSLDPMLRQLLEKTWSVCKMR